MCTTSVYLSIHLSLSLSLCLLIHLSVSAVGINAHIPTQEETITIRIVLSYLRRLSLLYCTYVYVRNFRHLAGNATVSVLHGSLQR